MKRNVVLIILIMYSLIMVSCKEQDDSGTKNMAEVNIDVVTVDNLKNLEKEMLDLEQYSMENKTDTDGNIILPQTGIAESEYGYYIPSEWASKKLLFIDKSSGMVVPLCNKADCNHVDKSCNADYSGEISINNDESDIVYDLFFLQFYDGNLYTLGYNMGGNVYLYKISEDGSSREQYMKLYKQELASSDSSNTMTYRSPQVCIHRGYVYYIKPFESNQKLRRISLDSGEEEILFELNSERGILTQIRPYGDFVCFQAAIATDDTYEKYDCGMFAFNVIDGEIKYIMPNTVYRYAIQDNIMYYESHGVIGIYNMVTGEDKILLENEKNLEFIADGKYIYMGKDNTLFVYNLEGEELYQVPASSNQTLYYFILGESDYFFAKCHIGEEEDQNFGYCYLNKSDIEKGTAEWTFINN